MRQGLIQAKYITAIENAYNKRYPNGLDPEEVIQIDENHSVVVIDLFRNYVDSYSNFCGKPYFSDEIFEDYLRELSSSAVEASKKLKSTRTTVQNKDKQNNDKQNNDKQSKKFGCETIYDLLSFSFLQRESNIPFEAFLTSDDNLNKCVKNEIGGIVLNATIAAKVDDPILRISGYYALTLMIFYWACKSLGANVLRSITVGNQRVADDKLEKFVNSDTLMQAIKSLDYGEDIYYFIHNNIRFYAEERIDIAEYIDKFIEYYNKLDERKRTNYDKIFGNPDIIDTEVIDVIKKRIELDCDDKDIITLIIYLLKQTNASKKSLIYRNKEFIACLVLKVRQEQKSGTLDEWIETDKAQQLLAEVDLLVETFTYINIVVELREVHKNSKKIFNDIDNYKKDISRLTESVESLKTKNADYKKSLQDAKKAAKLLNSINKETEAQNKKMETALEQLKAGLNGISYDEAIELKRTNDILLDRIKDVEDSASAKDRVISKKDGEIKELKDFIDKQKLSITKLENDYNGLKQSNSVLSNDKAYNKIPINSFFNAIKNKNIIVVGGNPVHSEISRYGFKNLKLVEAGARTIKIYDKNKVDLIVIMTSFIDHATTESIKNEARKSNISILMFNERNVSKLIYAMFA